MSYYDDSSLFLSPNGYKTSVLFAQKPMDANGQLAFTRSNDTATRVGPNGLIEKVRTNQVRNSTMVGAASPSTLPTNWVLTNNGLTFTVIGTGTEDGLTYIEVNATGTASSTNARIGFDSSTQILGATGQYWTNSFYFKKVSETAAPNSYQIAIFENTSAGSVVVGQVVSFSPTTTLARYSYSLLTSGGATIARVQPFVRFSLISGNSYNFTFRISATQMETGDIATDYIPTTTAAVSVGPVANLPRIDYTGGGCGKLLLEPQRTNLATFSEQFDNAAWTKTQSTITANSVVSPDGYTNADKLVEGSGSVQPTVLVNFGVLTTTLSQSVYAKAGERSVLALGSNTTDNTNAYAIFDLTNGACKALTSAKLASFSITSVGNGWYRCTVNFIASTSTAGHRFVIAVGNDYNASFSSGLSPLPAYTGNGSSGLYIWGAQLEAGAYASSYIPTLGASVTRGADACSKTGISSLIGQTEGTSFLDFQFNGTQESIIMDIAATGLSPQNRIILYNSGNNTINLVIFTASVQQASILSSAYAVGQRIKVGVGYKVNDFVLYINGVQIGTDNSGTVPATSRVDIGNRQDAGFPAPISVNQTLLFKTRLSNSELAQLTTI